MALCLPETSVLTCLSLTTQLDIINFLILKPSHLPRLKMKLFTLIVPAMLLAFAKASPTPASNTTLSPDGTDGDDVIATWAISVHSDGLCQENIGGAGGNTPSGCRNLAEQANSYNFASSQDPRTGVRFIATFFASNNCLNRIAEDDGTTANCNGLNFESFSVRSVVG